MARTSASAPRPVVTTRARVRAAMPSTRGSSALRTAVPSAGSASTSSPLAVAMPSALPNSPRWAEPTLRTTPTCGRATRAQPGDVPGAARAHLEDEEPGVLVGVEHGQRQADVVVVRAGRADRGPGGGEHLAEQVLGRGLARGAGDAQRCAARPAVSRSCTPAASRPSAVTGSSTTTQGRPSSGRAARARAAPAAAAAARKSCPSTRSPGSGDEQVAGTDGRASRAVTRPVTTAVASPGERRHRRPLPPRPGVSAITRVLPCSARTSRSTARSSKGAPCPSISWPVSCPLPATSSVSPGRARPTAAASAARRPGPRAPRPAAASGTSAAPASIAARMAAGSSERGLSSVTTRTSLPAAAAAPSPGACPGRGHRRSRAR